MRAAIIPQVGGKVTIRDLQQHCEISRDWFPIDTISDFRNISRMPSVAQLIRDKRLHLDADDGSLFQCISGLRFQVLIVCSKISTKVSVRAVNSCGSFLDIT